MKARTARAYIIKDAMSRPTRVQPNPDLRLPPSVPTDEDRALVRALLAFKR